MLIHTRHLFFRSERDCLYSCDRWFARCISIALFARDDAAELGIPYRIGVSLRFWLLPNFIWYQDFLCIEHGRPVYQERIVGIQNWPFSVNVLRSPRSQSGHEGG